MLIEGNNTLDMEAFFTRLHTSGIRVLLDDNGALRVKGKKEQLNAELVEELKAHKSEIADFLQHNPQGIAPVVEQAAVLPNLSEAEQKHLIEELNQTGLDRIKTDAFSDLTLHGLIEAQVVDNPNKIALEFRDGRLSYAQLNQQANKLAMFLRREGIEADALVGICLEPGLQQIMVMLAVLKSGGAYVPLDPDNLVLDVDCQFDLILSNDSLKHLLEGIAGKIYSLDDIEIKQAIDCCSAANPPVLETQNALSLACVLNGRCNDGKERGVMFEHGNIITLVDQPNYLKLDNSDVMAFCSATTSDMALFEVWGALANGATLIEIDRNLQSSPMMLKQALNLKGINVMALPMALVSHLVALRPDCFAGLDCLLVYGLPVKVEDINKLIDGGKPERLLYLYGVLENTTFSTYIELTERLEQVPLGKPVSAASCYVLDDERQLVAKGDSGTLYVGGFGLARGYLGNWQVSEAHFLSSPFSDDPNDRILSTGLKAKYQEDGNILLTEQPKGLDAQWPKLKSAPKLAAKSVEKEALFQQDVWQSQPLNTLKKLALLPGGCFVIFADNYGVGNRLAALLRLNSQDVVIIRAGQQFQQSGMDEWTLNFAAQSDYAQLLQVLDARQLRQVQVIHLWSIAALDTLAPCEPVFEQLAKFEAHLLKGLNSVELLMEAAIQLEFGFSRLNLVTRLCCSVTSDEKLIPSAATVAALVNKKHNIVQIDLGLDEMPPTVDKVNQLCDFIMAELTVEQRPELVAFRGRQRWRVKTAVCAMNNEQSRYSAGGSYLVITDNDKQSERLSQQLKQSVGQGDIQVLVDERADGIEQTIVQIRQQTGMLNGVIYCPDPDKPYMDLVQTILLLDVQVRTNPIEFCLILTTQNDSLSARVAKVYAQVFVQNKHNQGCEQWLHVHCKSTLLDSDNMLAQLLQMEPCPSLSYINDNGSSQ